MNKVSDRPFLNQSFSPRGGGIDFLGMRAVNLRMLQDYLIPGINNATADFGTYCLAAWIPWKFINLANAKDKFNSSKYQAFREAIEIAIAYSQRPESPANDRFGSPRTRIGVQQKFESGMPLRFEEVERTDATSLFAAPLYGPSLRYLKLISGNAVAIDGTSTEIPLTASDDETLILVGAVESSLKACPEHNKLDRIDVDEVTTETLDALGNHGLHPSFYRNVSPSIKRAFLQKFLVSSMPGDGADRRRQTAKLICETIRQYEFFDAAELRACWHTGLLPNGKPLELVDTTMIQHRQLWALFQSRQLQRTYTELFLRCFEFALQSGAQSVAAAMKHWRDRWPEEFLIDTYPSLEAFIREEAVAVTGDNDFEKISIAWQSKVHGGHALYDEIPQGEDDSELWRALRMMARWWIRSQHFLPASQNAEFLRMGERGRMSMRWFSEWLTSRLSKPLSTVVEEVFSEAVFSQHIKVALTHTVWTAGIFTAVVKGMTYAGVFRAELAAILSQQVFTNAISKSTESVISTDNDRLLENLKQELFEMVYGERFIKRWQGVNQVWARLTRHLLKNLLPDIQEEISAAIQSIYLLDDAGNCYLKDYRTHLEFELLNADSIRIRETLRYTVVARSEAMDVRLRFMSDVEPVVGKSSEELFNISVLSVNGKSHIHSIRRNTQLHNGSNRHLISFDISLKGSIRYDVERVIERIAPECDPCDGPSRGTEFARYVKGLEVRIKHPPELKVFFKLNGAIGIAIDGPQASSGILDKRYDGLLLPKQGFRVFWHKCSDH